MILIFVGAMSMYRILFTALSVLLLGANVASIPASAGEYYDGGNYRSYERIRRSADCCAERIVRHERTYRDDYERPYNANRYYSTQHDHANYEGRREVRHERSYREDDGQRYDSHNYYSTSYDRPTYRRSYYGRRDYNSSRYYGTSYSSGTIAYNDQPRRFYAPGCRPSRYKLYDDAGGWVWGKTAVCY